MEFSPDNLTYISRKLESETLVWIRQINRYLRFEEPAFWVFRQIAEKADHQDTLQRCMEKYRLHEADAEKFIGDIKAQLATLYDNYQEPVNREEAIGTLTLPSGYTIIHHLEIAGKIIRFSFGDHKLAALIYPIFSHMEVPLSDRQVDQKFEVCRQNHRLNLIINGQKRLSWPQDEINLLRGALYMKVIELIHHEVAGEWMGVIHAATIFSGDQALMFPGGPGEGKSTIAALMMAQGCGLIADDFTPISLKDSLAYPFPGRISVKKGALPVLKPYFHELESAAKGSPSGKAITWLTPRNSEVIPNKGYPVRAVIFVKFEKHLDCEIRKMNPLEGINEFLKESWMENHPRTAEQFMDWLLEIPFYTLQYGDSEKAIASVLTLLNHDP